MRAGEDGDGNVNVLGSGYVHSAAAKIFARRVCIGTIERSIRKLPNVIRLWRMRIASFHCLYDACLRLTEERQ